MWKSITSDKHIIDVAKHGLKVEFEIMSRNDYAPVFEKRRYH